MVRAMFGVLLASHWAACAWMLHVTFREDLTRTWLYNCGYCITLTAPRASQTRFTERSPLGDEPEYGCLDPGSIYAASLYWAVMTITSIGYGDIAATPAGAVGGGGGRVAHAGPRLCVGLPRRGLLLGAHDDEPREAELPGGDELA